MGTDKVVPDDRGSWSTPLEFIMSCLNYAIGLGNVWRFPYLCYRNGGGAFLFPYIVMLFVIGLPIFFLELAIGQYAGLGPIEAFQRIAPFFQGLGWCTLVVITLITIYYQVIVAWTVMYLVNSFSAQLGWGSCDHDFNSERCFSAAANDACLAKSGNGSLLTFFNKTCVSVESLCAAHGLRALNATHCGAAGSARSLKNVLSRVLASEEYYNDYVLGRRNATWEDWGDFHWELCLYLLLSWVVLYACLARGVQSSGKAAYFTTIFPIVLLAILLVRGATLEGAMEGVRYYITPHWDTLLRADVWGDAASQVFYSFGIGCGSLIALSSYSKFHNNCHTDALIVAVANLFTAVFAGFAVFTVMGFLAHQQGVSVREVVNSGPGLAFVVYPEAILRMPLPQLWAALFFFMLFTLGLGSQFGGVQAVTTAITDRWPSLQEKQWLVTLCACAVFFVLEIPMCYSGGVYLFTLLDWNTAAWAILLVGFAEVIIISWVYGCERFMGNLTEMGIGFHSPVRAYWRFVWVFATPVMCLAVFAFVMYEYVPATYGTYKFPAWADVIGWLISISTILPFPAFALYRTLHGGEVGLDLYRPSSLWRAREQLDEEASPISGKIPVEGHGKPPLNLHFGFENPAFVIDTAKA